ncbi:hypothetical protein Y032_0029g1918 [Ancylostoma ceylanicum]|nr:hypothetical protein Y032_0029g1918 [Ancylostoma ceylanicum]
MYFAFLTAFISPKAERRAGECACACVGVRKRLTDIVVTNAFWATSNAKHAVMDDDDVVVSVENCPSLRESPRRASKAVKPQGGSISSNSLLKQAIANRLKPQTTTDEGQLQQRYISVNDTNRILKSAGDLNETSDDASTKEVSAESVARSEATGSAVSNTPQHLNEKLAPKVNSSPTSSDEMKRKLAANHDQSFNSYREVSDRTDKGNHVDSNREEHVHPDSDEELWENNMLQNRRDQPMISRMRKGSLQHDGQGYPKNNVADDLGQTRHSPDINAKHSEFAGDSSPAKKKHSVAHDRNHLIDGSSNHFPTLSTVTPLASTDPVSCSNVQNNITGHNFTLGSKQNKIPEHQNERKGSMSPMESPHAAMTPHKCVTFSDQVQLHEIEPNDLPISENEEFESGSEADEESQSLHDTTANHQHIGGETPEIGLDYRSQQGAPSQFKEEECQTVESLLHSRFSIGAFFDRYSQTPHHSMGSYENLGSNSSLLSGRSSQESLHTGLTHRFSDNETSAPMQMMSQSIPQYSSHSDQESGPDFLRGYHRDKREQNHCRHVLTENEMPQNIHNLARLEANFISQLRGNTEQTPRDEEDMRRQFIISLRKEHRASAHEEDPCDPIHTVGSLDSILSSGSRESVISSVSIRKEAATHRNFMY